MVKLLGTLDSELMNIQKALTNHFVGRIGRHFVFRIYARNNSIMPVEIKLPTQQRYFRINQRPNSGQMCISLRIERYGRTFFFHYYLF